jgi:hypothetical protein
MDTCIYTRQDLHLLPQTVDVWVYAPLNPYAPLNQTKMEGILSILSQVYRLPGWYSFQASPCVGYATCLKHISIKKWLIFMSAFHILFDNKSRWVNEINVCINTWQSWLFIPYNLPSFKFINLDMLKHIHQKNVDS